MKVENIQWDINLSFQQIDLVFHAGLKTDVFRQYQAKTLAETLGKKRYQHLVKYFETQDSETLNTALGEFLYGLKASGNDSYTTFLNRFGDETYCSFSISDPLDSKKGLYCYALKGMEPFETRIQYVGRSHDPFKKRVNNGYGNISPKNCYLDGQATNCHLNSILVQHQSDVAFFVCPLDNRDEIDDLEKALIRKLKPDWNILLRPKKE